MFCNEILKKKKEDITQKMQLTTVFPFQASLELILDPATNFC